MVKSSLSEGLDSVPKLRPGQKQMTAEEDIRAITDGAVADAVTVVEVAGEFTRLKSLGNLGGKADHN